MKKASRWHWIGLIISSSTLLLSFLALAFRNNLSLSQHRLISIIVVVGILLTVFIGYKINMEEEKNG